MTDKLLEPRQAVAKLSPYDPGSFNVDISMSANENPYDVPAELRAEVMSAAAKLSFNRYPDPLAMDLRSTIADRYGLEIANVVIGNGGDELIQALLLAYGGGARTAMTFEPTFVMYKILAEITGTKCVNLKRGRDFGLPKNIPDLVRSSNGDIVFVCSPNNPTGNLMSEEELSSLLSNPDIMVVVDEAYQEFSKESFVGWLNSYPNLMILRTFSKAFSLAGLRVGYLLGNRRVIDNILKVKLPYNVNVFSQAAATVLMRNQDYFDDVINEILSERQRVGSAIDQIPDIEIFPSAANFILIRSGRSGGRLWRSLLAKGILVRDLSRTAGLEDCLRITIGTPTQNDAVIAALESG